MEFCSPLTDLEDRCTLGPPPGLALSTQPLPVLWHDLGLPSPGSPKSSRQAFLAYTSLSTALSGGMQSQAPSP